MTKTADQKLKTADQKGTYSPHYISFAAVIWVDLGLSLWRWFAFVGWTTLVWCCLRRQGWSCICSGKSLFDLLTGRRSLLPEASFRLWRCSVIDQQKRQFKLQLSTAWLWKYIYLAYRWRIKGRPPLFLTRHLNPPLVGTTTFVGMGVTLVGRGGFLTSAHWSCYHNPMVNAKSHTSYRRLTHYCSTTQLGVFTLPGWYAGPSQGYHSSMSPVPIYTPGVERGSVE